VVSYLPWNVVNPTFKPAFFSWSPSLPTPVLFDPSSSASTFLQSKSLFWNGWWLACFLSLQHAIFDLWSKPWAWLNCCAFPVSLCFYSSEGVRWGLKSPLCGKSDVMLSYIYEYYKTCTSFTLFIAFQLILNAFNWWDIAFKNNYFGRIRGIKEQNREKFTPPPCP